MSEDASFTWDHAKSDRCYAARGFDFEYVARLFSSSYLERVGDRFDYGEVRRQVIGRVGGQLYAIIYTQRGSAKHIISARRAHQKELDRWLK